MDEFSTTLAVDDANLKRPAMSCRFAGRISLRLNLSVKRVPSLINSHAFTVIHKRPLTGPVVRITMVIDSIEEELPMTVEEFEKHIRHLDQSQILAASISSLNKLLVDKHIVKQEELQDYLLQWIRQHKDDADNGRNTNIET